MEHNIDNSFTTEDENHTILKKLQNLNNGSPLFTAEYKFLNKYFSTLNPTLEDNTNDSINSVEQLLETYQSDPREFAIKGKQFLEEMSLDFMKLKLASVYGIKADDISLTYENKPGCYEIRVRHGEQDLECPAFLINNSNNSIYTVDKLNYGTRFSRVDKSHWETFFAIQEFEAYDDYAVNIGRYTTQEYINQLLEYLIDMEGKAEQLLPEASKTLTYEEER